VVFLFKPKKELLDLKNNSMVIFLSTVLSSPERKKSLKKEELQYFMVWRKEIL